MSRHNKEIYQILKEAEEKLEKEVKDYNFKDCKFDDAYFELLGNIIRQTIIKSFGLKISDDIINKSIDDVLNCNNEE